MRIFAALIALLLVTPAYGATRFYLPSSGTSPVSPAFSAGWNVTTGADRIRCSITKTSTALTSKAGTAISLAQNVLLRQYISDPLRAQTITGTASGQVRALENNANQDSVTAVTIKVVSGDGSIVRGTLLAITYPALTVADEMATALTNRYIPINSTLTSVSALIGDRLVIEMGYKRYATTPTGNATLDFGDNAVSDLPVDQTTTTASNPWIEFSQNITFGARRRTVLIQ